MEDATPPKPSGITVVQAISQPLQLDQLPPDLIISILEHSLLSTRPSVLATISKTLHLYINCILYRTVVLTSARALRAFHRTAIAKGVVLRDVKKLAISTNCPPQEAEDQADLRQTEIQEIILACKNLRVLALGYLDAASIPDLTDHRDLGEIAIRALRDTEHLSGRCFMSVSNNITHLRFTEPPALWISPFQLLLEFGNPPHLSHLQLSRRTMAHEGNDIVFVDEIRALLELYKHLRMLVVIIFHRKPWAHGSNRDVRQSHIWVVLEKVRELDDRLILVEGQQGHWENELKDFVESRS